MRARVRFVVALMPALAVAGCSTLESLPLVSELPKVPVPDVLKIEKTVDTPHTLIERALSGCDKRTEAGETACVKAALQDGKVTVPQLAAMLPACRDGQLCHVVYTTEDRIGLYSSTASRFVAHWRVDVDLMHRPGTLDATPISVVQV